MNYTAYAERAKDCIEEIYMLAGEDDIAALSRYCRQHDKDEVLFWFGNNRHRVQELAASAPARRKALLKRCDNLDRQLLILCALWFLRGSERVLREIADNMLDAPGGYRELAGRAGEAWIMTVTQTLFDWPFGGESPWG